MSDAYDLFREGQKRLRRGLAAQATVPLERAKRLEPEKASIREALGIAYFRLARWEDAERSSARSSRSSSRPTTTPTTRSGARSSSRAVGRGERPLQARELDEPGVRAVRPAILDLDAPS